MSYTRELVHPLQEKLNAAKEDKEVKQLLEEIICYKPKEDEPGLSVDVAIEIAFKKQKYEVVLGLPPSPLIQSMSEGFLHEYPDFKGFISFLKSTDSPQAHFYLGLKAYTQRDKNLPIAKKHLEIAMKAADWFPAEGYHILGYVHFLGEKSNNLLAAQFFQEAVLKSNGKTYNKNNLYNCFYDSYRELIFILNDAYALKARAEKRWDAIRQAKDVPVAKGYVSLTKAVESVMDFSSRFFSSAPTLADSAPKEISLTDILRIIYFCLRQEKCPERLYDYACFDTLGYLSEHVFDELDYFANPEEAARWAETLAKTGASKAYDEKHKPEYRKSSAEKRISAIPAELAQQQLLLEQKSEKPQSKTLAIEQEAGCRKRMGKF